MESGGKPLALNVNGLPGRDQPRPGNLVEAVQAASFYVAKGYSVDIGLMQVNSRNLPSLGYSLAQAFEPCSNLRGGALILTANYIGAAKAYGSGLLALQVALSMYNTGNQARGFSNGYVARYFRPGSMALAFAARPGDLSARDRAAGK